MATQWNLAPARDMVKWYFGITSPTPPSAFYLGLSSTSADPTLTWTELTVTNYARQALTWTYADTRVSNTADINFGNLGAGTVMGQGIWDASTGGNLLFWSDLTTALTFAAGHTLTYGIGRIAVTVNR